MGFSKKLSQAGVVHLFLLLAIVGVISFLTLSSSVPLKDKFLSSIFPKDASQAAQITILPTDRATLWDPGLNAVGGIPNRTTVCATLNASSFGNGTSDATSAIQNAINNCPAGQVVQLSAGEFKISGQGLSIGKGIVLRGAGLGSTWLKKSAGTNYPVVLMGVRWVGMGTSRNLATNAVKGSTSVTLASTTGLSAGQIVLIDKTTDSSVTKWANDCTGACQSWFSRNGRSLSEVKEIASVSGNTVTFTTPFHINYETNFAAQLTTYASSRVDNVGLEDISTYGGEGGDGGGGIRMEYCAYCWVKNVESKWSIGGSVALYDSFRAVVRDSFIHETPDPNPGGAGYGLSINSGTSDSLFENNAIWNFNKVMVMRAAGGGNVIGYNYMEDGYGSGYKSIPEIGMNASHMTTTHDVLFEGNESWNIGADARWGNAIFVTFLRNHATTQRRDVANLGLSGRNAVPIGAGHWWYSFIGNVIGSPNQSYPVGFKVWEFGLADSVGTGGQSDPLVADRAFRAGNWDLVSNSVEWTNASAQTIPDSYYLSSKPAFFGNNPWPWVDSTGSTKLYTLPARARFDSLMGITPTSTPSSTPAPSAAVLPSPSVAPSPSLTPVAGTVLFSDDFETGTIGAIPVGWVSNDINAGWNIQSGNGGKVYRHNGWSAKTTVSNTSWTDYSFEAIFKPSGWQSANDGLIFRYQDANNYYVVKDKTANLALYKVINGTTTTLATTPNSFNPANLYDFRVDILGSSIKVFVNGAEKISVTDSSITNGSVGLYAEAPVDFDNVTITALSIPLPTPPTPAKKGDLNNDGKIGVLDFSMLLTNWNATGTNPADLNNDSKVNVLDLSIMLTNWG